MGKEICALALAACLLLSGCEHAAVAEKPAPVENTATVSMASASGGEVKLPAPTPSGSPAPQSSLTFEKENDDVSYQFTDDGHVLKVSGGLLTVRVVAQALKCDIQVAGDARVRLMLLKGAAFTGTVTADLQDCVAVELDEKSTWTLTADTGVGGIVNGDTAFQNVISGGFSLSYDSELGENAYLAGEAKLLPGGGYLTPNI